MKIYVASSWRNDHYPEVVQAIRSAGPTEHLAFREIVVEAVNGLRLGLHADRDAESDHESCHEDRGRGDRQGTTPDRLDGGGRLGRLR